MPKNIIVLSDGTAQEGGAGHDTNVYKLFKMLENRTRQQIVFYDRGLGTDWRRLTGSAAGMGISKNILEAYRFIFEHFEAGDRLFLFGFSRGAATVTSLTHFIHHFGILPKSRPELIRRAWRIYQAARHSRAGNVVENWSAAADFAARHHSMWTRVRFLGLWDCVAALGVPFTSIDVLLDRIPFFRHTFHNFDLSDVVEHGRHAVAIDDQRKSFHPELWRPDQPAAGSMKQVWFPGMHSDVGGGYAEPQLSDITLEWMLCEATGIENGLRIQAGHGVRINPDAGGTMHDSRASGLARLYRRETRSWPAGHGKPTIHQSVLDRAARSRQGEGGPSYAPWILNQFAGDDEIQVEAWSACR